MAIAANCANCGNALRPGARFCPQCGTPPPPPAAAASCSNCGSALRSGARFCATCGAAAPVAALPRVDPTPPPFAAPPVTPSRVDPMPPPYSASTQPPMPMPPPPADAAPGGSASAARFDVPWETCRVCATALVEGVEFCVSCGTAVDPSGGANDPSTTAPLLPPPIQGRIAAGARQDSQPPPRSPRDLAEPDLPPPPEDGQVFRLQVGGDAAQPAASTPSGPLPPSSVAAVGAAAPAGSFREYLAQFAAPTVAWLGQRGLPMHSEIGLLATRAIRAALLDPRVYREVAASPHLQRDAWKLMGLAIVALAVTLVLRSVLTGALVLPVGFLISLAITQALVWLARAAAIHLAIVSWLKQPLTFTQSFGVLSYAQAPVMLAFLPVIGPAVELWVLISTAVASRDLTGCIPGRAIGLAICGWIGAQLIAWLLQRVVGGAFLF